MTIPTFIDTDAFANELTSLAYRLGFFSNAVVLKINCREIVWLCVSSDPKDQTAGQRAALTLVEIQSLPNIEVIMDGEEPWGNDADEELLRRAEAANGQILTADRELQSRARARGIGIVSIQSLRYRLQPAAEQLPRIFQPVIVLSEGEIIEVRVERRGKQEGQGVGYLKDGRMVVINDGGPYVGQVVQARIDKILQRPQSRELIFTTLVSASHA